MQKFALLFDIIRIEFLTLVIVFDTNIPFSAAMLMVSFSISLFFFFFCSVVFNFATLLHSFILKLKHHCINLFLFFY